MEVQQSINVEFFGIQSVAGMACSMQSFTDKITAVDIFHEVQRDGSPKKYTNKNSRNDNLHVDILG